MMPLLNWRKQQYVKQAASKRSEYTGSSFHDNTCITNSVDWKQTPQNLDPTFSLLTPGVYFAGTKRSLFLLLLLLLFINTPQRKPAF
jgi:hypothetical protein